MPQRQEDKIENLSSSADVVHTTAKQVISRRRKSENGSQMYKYENALAKLLFFSLLNMQICDVLVVAVVT